MKFSRKVLSTALVLSILMSIFCISASANVINVKSYLGKAWLGGSVTNDDFSTAVVSTSIRNYNCGYYATLRVAPGSEGRYTIIMSCQEKNGSGSFVSKSTSSYSATRPNQGSSEFYIPANPNQVGGVCNSADMDFTAGKTYRYAITVKTTNDVKGRYWGLMALKNDEVHGKKFTKPS